LMARLTTVGGSSARYCFSVSESMVAAMVTVQQLGCILEMAGV
jgi:hypothetical protein